MVWASFFCLLPGVLRAAPPATQPVLTDAELEELSRLPLEELMQIQVTSVTGTAEQWFQSPAALYVVTGNDIRRTGFRTLAEALRMVPGVYVGQTNAHAWSVGMRGFNGGLANKTLILIDGRTTYDPLFSGTFWDVQDVLLEDLAQIEVIRGPGATLWGANAVNGVINVTTKDARDTQGVFLEGGAGTEERGFGSARYGGKINDDAFFRVWGKYFNRDSLESSAGQDAHDDWDMAHGGFRVDVDGSEGTHLTLQGDMYNSLTLGESVRAPVPGAHLVFQQRTGDGRISGGNLLARLSQEGENSGWSLQGYYDRTDRVQIAGQVGRDTYDLDFRQHFKWGDVQEIIWGLGLRHTMDHGEAGATVSVAPSRRSLDYFTGFVQDTFTLVPDRLFFMAGSKFSHDSYTGFQVQPSGRLWWTPDSRQTLWGAISRPVRLPSRLEEEGTITNAFIDTGLAGGGPPSGIIVPLAIVGSDLEAEELLALEAGYRRKITTHLSLDLALFHNDYSRLILVPPSFVGMFNNDGWGESYGSELALHWEVNRHWRLEGSYSYVDVQIHGPVFDQDERNTPHHMAQLRSYFDVTDDLELNGALYYVDNRASVNADHFLRMDVGLTWRPTANVEVAIWGQNLLDPGHREASALEVQRGGYIAVTLRF